MFSVLLLVLAALVSGCATTNTPEARAAAEKRDKMMWDCRKATAAMRQGKFEEAKPLLDDALLTINASSAQDKQAKKARGNFNRESEKTFRGEPYERVMVYFYRGMIYWMEGELDNARACYRSGQLEDSDTENKAYASDYVLLDYLDGYITTKLGGDGSDHFARANSASNQKPLPPYNPKANTVFFAEFGRGPTKYAAGQYGELLRFHPGHSEIAHAEVSVAGQTLKLVALDDLSYQATTRGGRVMDHILGNKAVFKSSTSAFGDAAIISGAAVGATSRNNEVALGLIAAGILSKIVSGAATPDADIREWGALPQYLSFGALALPPGQHTGTIEFFDAKGRRLPNMKKTVTFNALKDRDTVVFISDQNN